MRKFLLGLVFWGLAGTSWASEQIYVNAALFYATESTKNDDAEVDRTALFYQLGLGLQMNGGLLLGGKYVALDQTAEDDDGNESTTLLSGYGPSLGYMHDKWLGVMLTYLLEPEKEVGSGSSATTWKGGSGYVLDVGFYIDQNGYSFGPMLSLVGATYKEFETNGETTDLESDVEETFHYPYFGFFIYF